MVNPDLVRMECSRKMTFENVGVHIVRSILITGAVLAVLLFAPVALAIPTLQLHMTNATYDPDTESWVTYDNPFTLEVIGAVTPAWVHFVDEVTLYVSVPEQYYNEGGWITIQGLPSAPPALDPVPDIYDVLGFGGRAPEYGIPAYEPTGYDGVSVDMPPHDVFPTYYWEVSLPDLMVAAAGELVQNWNPGETGWDNGDIQFYSIAYGGFDSIHFDLAGMAHNSHVLPRIAPFSHDAYGTGDGNGYVIPEPATLCLLGSGLIGLAFSRRRRRR